MVGFSAYAWQANQPFFVYWGRRTLKPLTPGEVAASADGEGNYKFERNAVNANDPPGFASQPPLLCKGGGFVRLREDGGIKIVNAMQWHKITLSVTINRATSPEGRGFN